MSDAAAVVRDALRSRGRLWPAPIEHHAVLPSTSDLLKERAREGAVEWTAALADAQTGGRGRHGRVWSSPPGGLYLSVVLRPSFDAVGLIPLAAGVAVVDAVREDGAVAELKWPNDVVVAGRKLAGILAEAASSASRLDWVVLGLGLNLRAGPAASSPTTDGPTSIEEITGAAPEPARAAAAVLAHLARWYDALRAEPAAVVDAWRRRALPWWGRRVEFRTDGRTVSGVAEEVDPDGALVLRLDDQVRLRVLSGEVDTVRLSPERAGPR